MVGAHQTGEVLSRLLNDVNLIKLMSTRLLADSVRVGAMGPAMLALVLKQKKLLPMS